MSQPELARATVWNEAVHQDIRTLIRRERPQVVHLHNTFPLISPAAYYAARSEGVPVVQTLHNYRLLCPNALFFREGRVCEDCLGKAIPWPGVIHACYRDSRPASGVVAAMLTAHRALGTWTRLVDIYVTLTEFARQKFIQGGLPENRLVTKPNFIYPDPGLGEGRGKYALFVGRLSQEKGVDTMLAAWEVLKEKVPLKIAGDGPLASKVAKAAERHREVEWLGRQPRDRVLALMKEAQVLLFPSLWYEGFPTVIVEAYAVGLPVIASDLGSMASLIGHGHTGLHFRAGDPRALALQVEQAMRRAAELERMRKNARLEFEAKYTSNRNYELLVEIYRTAARVAGARESEF